NLRIARNGAPLRISLDGKPNSAHEIVLRCWNDELNVPQGQQQYDWKLEVSIPNGGLIQRTDDFVFEAPPEGYIPSESVDMPATLPRNEWHGSANRSYFIRFNDNVFASAKLEIQAGGDHFIVWSSLLNPRSGSRNLEFDPAKQVATRKK